MITQVRPELQIKPGANGDVLKTTGSKARWGVITVAEVQGLNDKFDEVNQNINSKADAGDTYSKGEVDSKISGLVDSAPETLNTLKELSEALGDDPNFAVTVATQIGEKVDKSGVANSVYATNGSGSQTTLEYATSPDNNSIAKRGIGGRLKVADAIRDEDAVNLGQLDEKLSTKADKDDVYTKSEVNQKLASAGTQVDVPADEIFKSGTAQSVTVTGSLSTLYFDVYRNGLRQIPTDDFTVSGQKITFAVNGENDDIVVVTFRGGKP